MVADIFDLAVFDEAGLHILAVELLAGRRLAEEALGDGAADAAHVADRVALHADGFDIGGEIGHRFDPAIAEFADAGMADGGLAGDVVIDAVFGHHRQHLIDILVYPALELSEHKREIGTLRVAEIGEAFNRVIGQAVIGHEPVASLHFLVPSFLLGKLLVGEVGEAPHDDRHHIGDALQAERVDLVGRILDRVIIGIVRRPEPGRRHADFEEARALGDAPAGGHTPEFEAEIAGHIIDHRHQPFRLQQRIAVGP